MPAVGKDISSTTFYTPDSTPEELGTAVLEALSLGGSLQVSPDDAGFLMFIVSVRERNDDSGA